MPLTAKATATPTDALRLDSKRRNSAIQRPKEAGDRPSDRPPSGSRTDHGRCQIRAGPAGTDCLGAGFSGHGFKFGPAIGRIFASFAVAGTVASPIFALER